MAPTRDPSCRSLCCALVFLGMLWPAAVRAQIAAPDVPPRFVFGPATLEPAFAMHTGLNTNINREVNGVSDYETALIPHVDFRLDTTRGVLLTFAAVEFARFAEHPVESGHSSYSEVTWEGRNSLFQPRFLYSHRNQGARPSDFEEISQKSRRIADIIAPGLYYGLPGARLRAGVVLTRENTRYDAAALYQGSSLAEKLNFNRTTYSGDFSIRLTALTALVSSVGYSSDHFLLSPQRDSSRSQVNFGLDLAPNAAVTGSFVVGVRHATAPDPGAQPFDGIIWNGHLRHVTSRGTQVTVSFDRDTQYSFDVGHSYYVETQTRIALTQPVTRRLDLFGQTALLNLDYRGAQRGTERGVAVGGGIRYNVRPWMTVGVNADRITRSAAQPWDGVRVVTFWTHGTRFRHLERTTPGEDYTK